MKDVQGTGIIGFGMTTPDGLPNSVMQHCYILIKTCSFDFPWKTLLTHKSFPKNETNAAFIRWEFALEFAM